MRSAEHVWWELAMERGARDAELRRIAAALQPYADAARCIGLAFNDVAVQMSEAARQLGASLRPAIEHMQRLAAAIGKDVSR